MKRDIGQACCVGPAEGGQMVEGANNHRQTATNIPGSQFARYDMKAEPPCGGGSLRNDSAIPRVVAAVRTVLNRGASGPRSPLVPDSPDMAMDDAVAEDNQFVKFGLSVRVAQCPGDRFERI